MNNNIVIKLIALDLDGTLLQRRGKIHPANLKMLARIYEEKPDIKIIIATGRPMKHTINYAKACQIANNSGHIICYNGASIIDISNEQAKILQTKTITTSQVAKLLIFIKNKKLVLWGYGIDHKTLYFANQSCSMWKMWFLKYLTKLNLVKMTTSNIVPVYKFILFCHKKTITTITTQLQQFTDLECVVVGHNTIEITAQNVNKATAVQFLCQKWNIMATEVLAIGDQMNDYALINWAKYGIAMGNSTEKLKQVAFAITDSNKNGGVAKAIKKFVFNE